MESTEASTAEIANVDDPVVSSGNVLPKIEKPSSFLIVGSKIDSTKENKEESMSVVDSSVPVLPVTIPATGGYAGALPYSCNGLEGKDAAFIVGLNNEVGHRDNIRDTLENRFQVERLGRDLERSQHVLELSNQKFLAEMRDLIKVENEKTRDLLNQQEKDKKAEELAAVKTELCMLKHKPTAITPAVAGTSTIH